MPTRYVLTVTLNAAVDTTYVFDGFAAGGIHTVAEMTRVAGGKGNNVARVLKTLGAPVVATGFAGGQAGAFICETLQAEGVDVQYEPTPGESRTCFALVDRQGGTLTEIREKGPPIPLGAAEGFLARYRRLLEGAVSVVISGSQPPGIPADYYAQLVSAARSRGVFTVLDSSGKALADALAAWPDLVKPNRDELAEWAGRPWPGGDEGRGAALTAAAALRAAGPGAVAVTLGAAGLLYVGSEGTWAVRPPAITAVNPVGSGDSLVAGVTAGLFWGLPLPEALRLGVAAGTANALTPAVAAPRPADIERIRSQVIVERLD